jgi:hypothetical protein
MDAWMHGRMYGGMDGLIDGSIDGLIDWCMDAWTYGWMHGSEEVYNELIFSYLIPFVKVSFSFLPFCFPQVWRRNQKWRVFYRIIRFLRLKLYTATHWRKRVQLRMLKNADVEFHSDFLLFGSNHDLHHSDPDLRCHRIMCVLAAHSLDFYAPAL